MLQLPRSARGDAAQVRPPDRSRGGPPRRSADQLRARGDSQAAPRAVSVLRPARPHAPETEEERFRLTNELTASPASTIATRAAPDRTAASHEQGPLDQSFANAPNGRRAALCPAPDGRLLAAKSERVRLPNTSPNLRTRALSAVGVVQVGADRRGSTGERRRALRCCAAALTPPSPRPTVAIGRGLRAARSPGRAQSYSRCSRATARLYRDVSGGIQKTLYLATATWDTPLGRVLLRASAPLSDP